MANKEYIVYFVLSEKCSAPLSEVLHRIVQQGDGGEEKDREEEEEEEEEEDKKEEEKEEEEEEEEEDFVDSINSLGAFLLINGFVPIDRSREHILKYYDYDRISTYYVYRSYGKDHKKYKDQEILQESLKKGKLPIKVILGTTCVDYHWYGCSTGSLKVLKNGQIVNGNNPRSSSDDKKKDDNDASRLDKLHIKESRPSTSTKKTTSTIRLTSEILTKFLRARGVRGDITGPEIHRLANSFLPKCWSLKHQAGEHLSRPDSFAKYPLLVFFNVFEEMLYLCITSTVSDHPYSSMDQAYIEEYMRSSLHTNTYYSTTDSGKPNTLSERMFFILRFVSIVINSLFSLNSIIRKHYPQYITEVNRIFKTVNDDILKLYRSIKAGDSLVANQSNCLWVISHLFSCRSHAIRIKGCYLEATYGFKTMKLLSKLVDREYVSLLETEGVEKCIDFNEDMREELFSLDEISTDTSNNNSFYLVATSQAHYQKTAKVYGNHNCRIPDKEYQRMMNNDDGNRNQRVLDYIKTKRVTFFNYAVISLPADIFRRMTWPVLEDISKSLGQAAGGSLLSNQLRPTFNYFMTRHIQALLGCEVCSRNVSKKFSSCIRFLNDAQKTSGLLPYFRAFRCLPSFGEKEFAWIREDSFNKICPEMAIEMLLDMVLKADFPIELRRRFVREVNKSSKEEGSQLTQTGQGNVRYGDHLQLKMDEDFAILRIQMSQRLTAIMDKVQDVYSFVFVFFLALSQELEYIVCPKGVSHLRLSNQTKEYSTDKALVEALEGYPDSPNNTLTTFINSMSKMGVNVQGLMDGGIFDLAERYPLNCRIKLVDKMPTIQSESDEMEAEVGSGVSSEDIVLMELPVQVSNKTADYNALTSLRIDKEVADLGGHKWFLYNGGNIITEEMVAAAKATPNSKVERINMVVMDHNSAGLLYNYCLVVALWAMRNAVRLSNKQNPFPLVYVLNNRQVNVKTPYPTKTTVDATKGLNLVDEGVFADQAVSEIASGVRKVVRALGMPGINLMLKRNIKSQMIAKVHNKISTSDTARGSSISQMAKNQQQDGKNSKDVAIQAVAGPESNAVTLTN